MEGQVSDGCWERILDPRPLERIVFSNGITELEMGGGGKPIGAGKESLTPRKKTLTPRKESFTTGKESLSREPLVKNSCSQGGASKKVLARWR